MVVHNTLSALEKACCDPKNSSIQIRKLTLKVKPSVQQLQKLVLIAAKCNNHDAIFDILFTALSYLSISDQKAIIAVEHQNETGDTLLHLMCRDYGWNTSVLVIVELSIFLRKVNRVDDSGLFTINCDNETPLLLACENGYAPNYIMSSILQLSKRQNIFASLSTTLVEEEFYKSLLSFIFSNEQNILSFIQLIAQFNDNDQIEIEFMMRTIVEINPKILSTVYHCDIDGTGCEGCFPIHIACFYQHPALIEFCLLNSPLSEGGLIIGTIQNTENAQSKTPLDYLAMSLGSNDNQYPWQCLDACVNALPNLSLLNLIVEYVQSETIRKVLLKKRVLNQIITRYNLRLISSSNNLNETILFSAIKKYHDWKLHSNTDNSTRSCENSLFYDFCKFLVERKADSDSHNNSLEELATLYDLGNTQEKQRLPLHSAIDCSIHWNDGLQLLLNANFDAIEEIDPLTNLVPFLLAAADTTERKESQSKDTRDLDVIYNILRLRPNMTYQQIL
jgi:hypothetical protein